MDHEYDDLDCGIQECDMLSVMLVDALRHNGISSMETPVLTDSSGQKWKLSVQRIDMPGVHDHTD